MKKILLALALIAPSAAMAEPIAYPGSAWANVTGPGLSGEEQGNWVVSGKIQQGADWIDVNGWKLGTAVSVMGSMDTKGFEWNNKVVPALSASVRKNTSAGQFELGVQLVHEKRFGKLYVIPGSREATGVQMFANYWVGWGR